ncbi:uncharacterized protein LOC119659101 isoform X2 [Hermetia illucens]|uniref:uncharacterized protein LOC119659101 isoform X2 n=1 Tax=Hermetia illucens TaxID=343691 RepID=UPI0018CBF98F|nr:uncharacterized protein LOC119659101 isoform X2 [Hermetia illucens]
MGNSCAFVKLDYGKCSIRNVNKTHADADIIIKRTFRQPFMQLSVLQICTKRRKTVILKRKFEFCNEKMFLMTDFFSLYVVSIVNAFFNGAKITCPITPRTLSIRSFSLNSKIVPLQLFYRPDCVLIVNGTFFEGTETSNFLIGSFALKMKIERSTS